MSQRYIMRVTMGILIIGAVLFKSALFKSTAFESTLLASDVKQTSKTKETKETKEIKEIKEIKLLIDANVEFAVNIFHQLQKSDKNTVFSPYSIYSILNVMAVGAKEKTKEEMQNVLNMPIHKNQHEIVLKLNKVITGTKTNQTENNQTETDPIKNEGIIIKSANGLWHKKQTIVQTKFKSIVSQYYHTEIKPLDQNLSPEKSADIINKWVSKKTNNKIKKIINAENVSKSTRLMLVNAIYFNGKWKSPFNKEKTEEKPFYISKTRSIQVPMMTQKQQVNFYETEIFQMSELPYKGDNYSMIIMLPKKNRSLNKIVELITTENLKKYQDSMSKREVRLMIPRFTVAYEKELKDPLKALGMIDGFLPSQANFSALTINKGIYISKMFHKAVIEVAEEGTEAAAVTGAQFSITSLKPPPIVFQADHPFIFFMRENKTKIIVFMGAVIDPTN